MKLTKSMFAFVFVFIVALLAFSSPVLALQRFEDEDLAITTKLPPQYLGWQVAEGSSTKTEPMYYKVTAYVPGLGETLASEVTTAYTTYAGLASTNSLRMIWAPVSGATYYKLYRASDNISFYLIASPTVTTYLDEGAANGAAFSAATPRGGNLKVEREIDAGLKTFTLAQMNASSPRKVGIPIYVTDAVTNRVCISSGTNPGAYTLITPSNTHCN